MGILIAYLLGILTASNPKNHHTGHDTDSCNTARRQAPFEPLSVMCIPPTEPNEERTAKDLKQRRETITFWIELASAVILLGYFGVTILIWSANKDAAESSRRQLEMIDRPWIKDTAFSAFDMRWQQGSYLGWVVTVRTENVGHSVATGIFPEVKLIAIEGADFIDYPRREAQKVCDEVSTRFEKIKSDPSAWAASVFPGEPRDFAGYNVYLLPSEVEKKSFDGGTNVGKSIMPMLVGCIVYHYPSSEHAHHTGFVYMLSHTDDPALAEPTRIFFGIGKKIPRDKVTLTKVGRLVD